MSAADHACLVLLAAVIFAVVLALSSCAGTEAHNARIAARLLSTP